MPPSKLSDPALIERCLGDDPDAWQALVERYARLVYSVTARMRLRPADSDDVFQETFLALLSRLGDVRKRERIGLWLAATARRKALDRLRRGPAAREGGLDDAADPVDPSPLAAEELLQLERQALVRQAVETLPERCRTLLEGLFWRDPPLPYRDLARVLGVAAGSLGPTRQRCFDKLVVALRAAGWDAGGQRGRVSGRRRGASLEQGEAEDREKEDA